MALLTINPPNESCHPGLPFAEAQDVPNKSPWPLGPSLSLRLTRQLCRTWTQATWPAHACLSLFSLWQPQGGCWPSTHGAATLDPLRGLDGVVQTGSPQVDVLVGREGGKQVQQAFRVHVVVIVHVAEPSEGGGRGLCTEAPHLGGSLHRAPPWVLSLMGEVTYFRPDSMNLSYSTDILQHSAWRVRTAEQLVLIMRPPAQLEEM